MAHGPDQAGAADARPWERVARRLYPDARLLEVWRPGQGTSARVTGLVIARPGGAVEKVIVRQPGPADLRADPHVAAKEFRVLGLLRRAGLPVPDPRGLDESCEILPTPYLATSHIDGAPDPSPEDTGERVRRLAGALADIHAVACAERDVAALPRSRLPCPVQGPAEPGDGEAHVVKALAAAGPAPERNPPVLLHGDFWPGNTLWRHGRLVGIVDWEDAAWGEPLADLASARLEIAWAFGDGAVGPFTRAYRERAGVDLAALPHWDLFTALRTAPRIGRWGLAAARERAFREAHRRFAERALAALGRR